ncbi:hypothetical protein GWO43_01415 [candidate division KSB1 bacterium]|nr:hypothetical protein [candidate division KSB1 bacterium]NIR69330.1 hypothetical protein [candidate division KSB1 bacterium]NIS22731.1 hypothetical protein [candidate division KSB1 bacterium]NIT69578.1 hypothetical protein [candidate division KSB1 bacterium]NIU23233.1 hypothetical protein [candidate division KSB1 bacterium]
MLTNFAGVLVLITIMAETCFGQGLVANAGWYSGVNRSHLTSGRRFPESTVDKNPVLFLGLYNHNLLQAQQNWSLGFVFHYQKVKTRPIDPSSENLAT